MQASKKYVKICLTRFGAPLQNKMYSLRTYKNIVLIVPLKEKKQQMQSVSDFDISITSQPHCGAAAIAIFLHEFYSGRELAMHFENPKYKIAQK